MTLGEMQIRTLTRLDESTGSPVAFTAAEVTAALDRAQRIFAALTLSIERAGTLTLSGGQAWANLLSAFPRWFLPLRCSRNTVAGTATPALWGTPGWGEAVWGEADTETITATNQVKPATLAELDALDPAWQNATGDAVLRYGTLGFSLGYFYPAVAAGARLDFVYAAMPAALVADGDTPEIPAENHPALVDYAVFELPAMKWGGEYLMRGMPLIERFLDAADKAAAWVRARSLALRYERQPFELTAADRSRLIKDALAAITEAREVRP